MTLKHRKSATSKNTINNIHNMNPKNKVILKNTSIIVELGGMQISREELNNIKANLKTNSDREAMNHLVAIAENAFSRYVEQYG